MGTSYYLAGEYTAARELLEQAETVLSSDAGYASGQLQGTRLVLSLTEHHLGITQGVIKRLEIVLTYAKEIGHCLYESHVHLALALLRWDRGETDEAARHLYEGFQVIGKKELHNFPFLNHHDTVRACLLVFELEIREAYDLVRELLISRYAEAAEPKLWDLEQHPAPRLRAWGQDLLRAIHQGRIPFLEIRTFGGLELTRGGSLMREEAWDRLQPKRLLLAILSHSGGKASKEVLMEELWPGEMSEKSENNFKVTLMRLRRALEPNVHPIFGSSYIHLQNNLVYLDPEFTRNDADEFLKAVDRGRWLQQTRDAKGAKAAYEKALAFYKGDFLPLETSLPVADRRRDELKRVLMDTLLRLSKLAEEQGTLKKAAEYLRRVLAADPLREEACQAFMRLCLTLGDYNEALRSFGILRKNLRQELKSGPAPQTLALYQKLREKASP
jgi:DNA-binding SARP family transcriptional activator